MTEKQREISKFKSINYCPEKVMQDFGNKPEMIEICHRYSMTKKHSGEPELEIYQTPIKREFWLILNTHVDHVFDEKPSEDLLIPGDEVIAVVSAEWAESEIQRLKEALKEARANFKNLTLSHISILNTSMLGFPDKMSESEKDALKKLIKKIDEVLKDE